jgi:molybdopterin-guanine dinucleotide biosynthesis protein A
MCGSLAGRQQRLLSFLSTKHSIFVQPAHVGQSLAGRLVTRQKATAMTEAFGVPGVVLAGGLGRRIGGGDKPLREIGSQTILARVLARLEPQCECLLLSANGDPLRFASFGLPVIADGVMQHPGPLAGILAGLDWAAAHRPDAQWILSAPGDCPFLPRDLVVRLRQAVSAQGAELAVAASQGRSHPVIGLWKIALRDALREALLVERLRKVQGWTARYRVATVAWPAEPVDPFFNVNTVEDLAEAERLAALEGLA